ncbi:MAG TPA: ferritin-like domain-containing protein [Chitinophagales bacterium]|nr:ferritin-like domain-containing protein [Chitinophagales bacterium]
METLIQPSMDIDKMNIITDVFSQAITGEIVGMSNFAALAETVDDVHEKMEAVEHANSERMHAEGFLGLAAKYGLKTITNIEGVYWKNVRDRFLEYARKKDFIACLIIQEVMLESFAVSMYRDTGRAIGGEIGELFLATSDEEKEHLEHSTDILRAELERNPDEFIAKFEEVHYKCMSILAEWSATTDLRGHCGVCNGSCMKDSLHHLDLSIETLRGNAFALYARALDNIGIPGEKSIVWIANLPA